MTSRHALQYGTTSLAQFESMPFPPGRHELVRGTMVREPPAGYLHGQVAARVAAVLADFATRTRTGEAVGADTGFVLAEDPPTVRAPDAAYVAKTRTAAPASIVGFARFVPDLAVEIISPSDRHADVEAKVLEYLEAGVRTVWIVGLRHRTVTVYCASGEVRLLRDPDVLEDADVLPGFSIPVRRLFED